MKVLITGRSGFIGSHLYQRLEHLGVKVVSFEGDVRNFEGFKGLDFDVVFHLAAAIPHNYKNDREIYETNLLGTLNVLEACKARGGRIIFPSTNVYGVPSYLPVDENHPLNPMGTYARSKLLAETLCRYYFEEFGVPAVILRLSNIYGPGQSSSFLIPKVVKAFIEEKYLKLKNLDSVRDFLYIDDLIDLFVRIIKAIDGFDIFNVGYGEGRSVKDVIDVTRSLTRKDIRIDVEGVRDTIERIWFSIEKVKKTFDWKPKVSIEEGIRRMIQDEGFGDMRSEK